MKTKRQNLTTKEILENYIYPNLDFSYLLAELNPKDKGRYLYLTCPNCGKKEAYIYKTKPYIKCNRINKCDFGISLWSYIKQSRNLTNKETLYLLAEYAGVDLKQFDDNNYSSNYNLPQKNIVRIRIIKKPIPLLEYFNNKTLFDYLDDFENLSFKLKFQTLITMIYHFSLMSDQTKKDNYYKNRLITPPEDIGFLSIDDIELLEEQLSKKFDKELLEKFIFKDSHFRYKGEFAIIPSFDLYSNLLTAIRLRNIYPSKLKEIEVSYQRIANPLPYPLTREKLQKFNTFYFCEGHIDGLSLGVENFVAIEGVNSLNPYKLGIFKDKKIILAFDNDEAGKKGAKKMAQYLEKLGITYQFLVWDTEAKDINELKKLNLLDKVSLVTHL